MDIFAEGETEMELCYISITNSIYTCTHIKGLLIEKEKEVTQLQEDGIRLISALEVRCNVLPPGDFCQS